MGRELIHPAALAGIEVRNAPSGAPYVCVDGTPIGVGVSISDRAGWAVCVTSPTGLPAVGCDLELVEPRSPGFVRDFLTVAEQHLVASCAAGDERDAVTNLIWSAKESALKVLRVGLRRDTRTLEVTPAAPRADGWGALTVQAVEGTVFSGWSGGKAGSCSHSRRKLPVRRPSRWATREYWRPRNLDIPGFTGRYTSDIPRFRASTM